MQTFACTSSEECIKELIGADNANRYAVASQKDELRRTLRMVAGVPLLFIERGLLFDGASWTSYA